METGIRHSEFDRLMCGAGIAALWAEAERGSGKGTRMDGAMEAGERDRSAPGPPHFASAVADKSVRSTPPKRLGEMAEAEFVAKAERLGFAVACPWGDSERYDFIVDAGGKLWRVQLKSAHRAGQDGCYSFRLHGSSLAPYEESEIDAIVAYVVPEDVWYVFPVRALRGLRSLKLFSGSRRKRSRFERFREAWGIFESQKSEGRMQK